MQKNIEGKDILNGTRGKIMSKELELFQELRYEYLRTIKDDKLDTIEKSLKALEIIKETRVDTNFIKLSKDYDDYCGMEVIKMLNQIETTKQRGITQEEYDLLKEILL